MSVFVVEVVLEEKEARGLWPDWGQFSLFNDLKIVSGNRQSITDIGSMHKIPDQEAGTVSGIIRNEIQKHFFSLIPFTDFILIFNF